MLKMNSQTKPVKIRIKSGGEEHASLNSLKNNFHVLDVCDLLDNRLSRWLRQQNQHELANELDVLFPAASFEINDETIASLLRLFFRHDIPSTTFGLLDFAKYWHEHNDMVNFMNLLYCSLTVTKYYYYNDKSIFTDKDWELILTPYKDIDQEINRIIMKMLEEKTSPNNQSVSHFKERAKQIIVQYKKIGRNYDIDYNNEDEVNLVEFINFCNNTKNRVTNWEIIGYYAQRECVKQFEGNKKEPKQYKKEWKLIKAITMAFFELSSVKGVQSIVKKYNVTIDNYPDKISNSWELKKFIDTIVEQLFI